MDFLINTSTQNTRPMAQILIKVIDVFPIKNSLGLFFRQDKFDFQMNIQTIFSICEQKREHICLYECI